jgi:hypothetical protein
VICNVLIFNWLIWKEMIVNYDDAIRVAAVFAFVHSHGQTTEGSPQRPPQRRPRSPLSRFRGNRRSLGRGRSDAAAGQTDQWFLSGAEAQVMATGTIANHRIVFFACPNFS